MVVGDDVKGEGVLTIGFGELVILSDNKSFVVVVAIVVTGSFISPAADINCDDDGN